MRAIFQKLRKSFSQTGFGLIIETLWVLPVTWAICFTVKCLLIYILIYLIIMGLLPIGEISQWKTFAILNDYFKIRSFVLEQYRQIIEFFRYVILLIGKHNIFFGIPTFPFEYKADLTLAQFSVDSCSIAHFLSLCFLLLKLELVTVGR